MNKILHNNIYGEDLFKDNVKIENCALIVKPIVPFSLIVELVNFIISICEIIYWDGEGLTCPECGEKLYRNSYHERLINKIYPVKLQKYICSNKEYDYFNITNIDHIVPKYSNYEIAIRNEPYTQGLISYKSFEKVSKHDK
ncbi:MAG: hypothetical protein LBD03_08600 [Methanobrevibacter sp.]|nr:hypothetical protein [Candidatus Methanovirga procula]